MRCAPVMSVILWLSALCHAQAPTFGDYPVRLAFRGAATPLNYEHSGQCGTPNNNGAVQAPNFADHYVVVQCFCYADHISSIALFITNAVNGRVYKAPFTVIGSGGLGDGLSWLRASRAIHVVGSFKVGEPSVDRWYTWNGRMLELKYEHRIPVPDWRYKYLGK